VSRLVVDGWGKTIASENDQIVVKEREANETRIVFRSNPSEIEQVIVTGSGSITTRAIELLAENGVGVIFIDWKGQVRAMISPPIMRTVNTRREQYRAFDEPKGGELAKEFVRCKMRNQMSLLGTMAKTRRDSQPEKAQALSEERHRIELWFEKLNEVKTASCKEIRDAIMGIEGNASAIYWNSISQLIEESFQFRNRSGRYATDPVNALLNYGYAVLEGECWKAIHYAGLDPYGGFLHVDRPGRASMVLDLMEMFRQQIVDKVVFELIFHKRVKPKEFEMENGVCKMQEDVRKLLLTEILSKMEDYIRLPEKRMKWSDVIQREAVSVAKFLRGETTSYRGFWMRW